MLPASLAPPPTPFWHLCWRHASLAPTATPVLLATLVKQRGLVWGLHWGVAGPTALLLEVVGAEAVALVDHSAPWLQGPMPRR